MNHMIPTTKHDEEHCKDARAEAKNAYPEAAKLVAVTGGYMAFDTLEDYESWKAQK